MNLRLAVLADAANQSKDGKLNILGEFNVVRASVVPAHWPMLSLVIVFDVAREDGEGPHSILIRCFDPDENQVGPTFESSLSTPPLEGSEIPVSGLVILRVNGLPLPKYGTYHFDATVRGLPLARIPLHFLPTPPPEPETASR